MLLSVFAQGLEIYVFDDADLEPAAYLGLAKVPLISLANDKPIRGTFELRKVRSLQEGGAVCLFVCLFIYLLFFRYTALIRHSTIYGGHFVGRTVGNLRLSRKPMSSVVSFTNKKFF